MSETLCECCDFYFMGAAQRKEFLFLCDKCLKYHTKKVREQNKRKNKTSSLHTKEWIECLKAHNFKCKECFIKSKYLTLDHIIPMFRGGMNNKSNLQPLCGKCHEFKGMLESKERGNKKKRLEAKELKIEGNKNGNKEIPSCN